MASKGHWKCTNCPNIETFEREVYCWKCGEGEMVYVAPEQTKPRLVWTRGEKAGNPKANG